MTEQEKKRTEEIPKIELYKVEGIMVHAGKIVRNCVICLICAFIAIVMIVWIFTTKYNERNQNWLEVYNRLLESRQTQTEVLDGTAEEMEQFPAA